MNPIDEWLIDAGPLDDQERARRAVSEVFDVWRFACDAELTRLAASEPAEVVNVVLGFVTAIPVAVARELDPRLVPPEILPALNPN
jgi:hypothetical protein